MATIGLYARRRQQNRYYVRGVEKKPVEGRKPRTTSGYLMASDKEQAEERFEEQHPGYDVFFIANEAK